MKQICSSPRVECTVAEIWLPWWALEVWLPFSLHFFYCSLCGYALCSNFAHVHGWDRTQQIFSAFCSLPAFSHVILHLFWVACLLIVLIDSFNFFCPERRLSSHSQGETSERWPWESLHHFPQYFQEQQCCSPLSSGRSCSTCTLSILMVHLCFFLYIYIEQILLGLNKME